MSISAPWRKSSYSIDSQDCLEVADNIPGRIPIRDSKRPTVITAQPAPWAAFITAVRNGTLSA